MQINDVAASHAIRRLVEVVALNVRLTNAPIYRLLEIDARHGVIGGMLELASLVEYALALDLLEGELLDAIMRNVAPEPGSLPLHDRYFPTLTLCLACRAALRRGSAGVMCDRAVS